MGEAGGGLPGNLPDKTLRAGAGDPSPPAFAASCLRGISRSLFVFCFERDPHGLFLWQFQTAKGLRPIASGDPGKEILRFFKLTATRTREGEMRADIFGNLMEWGGVLEKLEQLRDSKTLDDHQAGLVRILRYPRNWRLREAVLRAIREVNRPTEELLREVLNLALNEEVYMEARTMAVHALADLMTRGRRIHSKNEITARSRVMHKMEALMSKTHSPLLREGIESFFKKLANRKIVPVSGP